MSLTKKSEYLFYNTFFIQKTFSIKVDSSGIQSIVNLSQGDMRRSLNILQVSETSPCNFYCYH